MKHTMLRVAQYVFGYAAILCAALFVLSLFKVNSLPHYAALDQSLRSEPAQEAITMPPFSVEKNGYAYRVVPLYDFSFSGLVVTYHHSSSWIDSSHREWKDVLNIADISVIWGANVSSDDYRRVRFSHGDWTGYFACPYGVTFDPRCFANIHIVTADPALEERVLRLRPGDQVHMQGYLVNYTHDTDTFYRNTSITRDDTGNGACEILYVKNMAVIAEANRTWRFAHRVSLIAGVISLVMFLGMVMIRWSRYSVIEVEQ